MIVCFLILLALGILARSFLNSAQVVGVLSTWEGQILLIQNTQ